MGSIVTRTLKKQQIEVYEVIKGYVVETNSDLTEGRGYQYTINGTATLNIHTARRLAIGKGVQGGPAQVSEVDLFKYGGDIYGPVSLIEPNTYEVIKEREEAEEAKKLVLRTQLLAKLEALGVTAEELEVLK